MDYDRNRNEGLNPNVHQLIPAVRGPSTSRHVNVIQTPPGSKPEEVAGISQPTQAAPRLPTMPMQSRQEMAGIAKQSLRDQQTLAQRANFYASVQRNNNQAAMNQRLRGVHGDNTHALNQSRLDVESQQQGVDPYATQYRESAEHRADAQSNADVAVKGGVADAYHGQAQAFQGQGDMYRGQGEMYRGQGEAYRGQATESRANANTLIPSQAAVNNATANIQIPAQANVYNSQAGVNHAQAGLYGEQSRDISATRPARIAGMQAETQNATDTTRANIESSRVQNRNSTVTTDSNVAFQQKQGGLVDAQTGQVRRQTDLLGGVAPQDAAAAEEQQLKNMKQYPDEYNRLHPGANTSVPASQSSSFSGRPQSIGEAVAPQSVGGGLLETMIPLYGASKALERGSKYLMGNDPNTAPVARPPVTEQAIQDTMRLKGLTREQVLAQLNRG